MLSDRPYMRDNYGRSKLSALTWVICILAGVFVIENVVGQWIGGAFAKHFFEYLTVSPEVIERGFVWTLFTHGIIHNPRALLGLGCTLLSLYVFGRSVEAAVGSRRFLTILIAGVTTGALTWLAVNWFQVGTLFGAGAGVSALLVVFACLEPDQPILLYFIDVGMRAKHLLIGWLVISVLGLVLLELPSRDSWLRMPHSAHLGGMLAGWLYFRFFYQREWSFFAGRRSMELPRWLRRARKAGVATPAFKVNVPPADNMKAEIDRILDKINSDGFHSLTAEEKRRLDLARDQLSRR